ncbi:DUF1796 family putative cysteine peptidase [Gammaproteobacteria bacterium]|nr:DUF1796 family putative cysteine peptidase [Gammaproteobacteria bacterium]
MIPDLPDTLYLSLGENCLADNVLSRHGLKSFSTIYSHGRSNIDYAIHLEYENHINLLKDEYLYYDYVGDLRVVRNRYYSVSSDIFSELHRNGFEFTHHDVLSNVGTRNNMHRKIHRLNYYRGKTNIRFFYHYRVNEDSALEGICKKAEDFLRYYEIDGRTCEVVIFTQRIVNRLQERDLEEIRHSNKVRAFVFNTLATWESDNQNLFWAIVDDDLIKTMIQRIVQ